LQATKTRAGTRFAHTSGMLMAGSPEPKFPTSSIGKCDEEPAREET
jgi:hypothetical protein